MFVRRRWWIRRRRLRHFQDILRELFHLGADPLDMVSSMSFLLDNHGGKDETKLKLTTEGEDQFGCIHFVVSSQSACTDSPPSPPPAATPASLRVDEFLENLGYGVILDQRLDHTPKQKVPYGLERLTSDVSHVFKLTTGSTTFVPDYSALAFGVDDFKVPTVLSLLDFNEDAQLLDFNEDAQPSFHFWISTIMILSFFFAIFKMFEIARDVITAHGLAVEDHPCAYVRRVLFDRFPDLISHGSSVKDDRDGQQGSWKNSFQVSSAYCMRPNPKSGKLGYLLTQKSIHIACLQNRNCFEKSRLHFIDETTVVSSKSLSPPPSSSSEERDALLGDGNSSVGMESLNGESASTPNVLAVCVLLYIAQTKV
jgi:hypothetical protein